MKKLEHRELKSIAVTYGEHVAALAPGLWLPSLSPFYQPPPGATLPVGPQQGDCGGYSLNMPRAPTGLTRSAVAADGRHLFGLKVFSSTPERSSFPSDVLTSVALIDHTSATAVTMGGLRA